MHCFNLTAPYAVLTKLVALRLECVHYRPKLGGKGVYSPSTVHRPPSTDHRPPSTVHCQLSTVQCPLSSVQCPLFSVQCPVSIKHFPLFTVHCSPSDARTHVLCPLFAKKTSTVHCPSSIIYPVHSPPSFHRLLSIVYCPFRHSPSAPSAVHRRYSKHTAQC